MRTLSVVAAVFLVWTAAPAGADYQRGRDAQERWDFAEAEAQYLAGAKRGDRAAMRALAFLYLRQTPGTNGIKLTALAAPHLIRAAELGDPLAQSRLAAEMLRDPKAPRGRIPALPNVMPDVPRGLDLLRASCHAGLDSACLQLVSFYSATDGYQWASAYNLDEARRWASVTEPLLRKRAAAGDVQALFELSRDRPWPGVGTEEQHLFALLAAYGRGSDGADVLKRAKDAGLAQQAAQWEIERGLRPASFDVYRMVRTVVTAIDRMQDDPRERVRMHTATNVGFVIAFSPKAFDARERRKALALLESQMLPVYEDFHRGLEALARRENLEHGTWLEGELRARLTPRQLHYLSSFFDSETGVKLVAARPRLQRVRWHAMQLAFLAAPEVSSVRRGTAEHTQRLAAFAKEMGVTADFDTWKDGAYERARFVQRGGLTLPVADPELLSQALDTEYLLMLGREYETVSRSFTAARMGDIALIESSEVWKTVLAIERARQEKLAALAEHKRLTQALHERAQAIFKRLEQPPKRS